jgi:hypothetical protein
LDRIGDERRRRDDDEQPDLVPELLIPATALKLRCGVLRRR